MYKSKLLVLLIVVIFVLFGVSQFLGNEALSLYSRAFILPFITLLYFVSVKKKTIFFSLFLIFYSISDLLELTENLIPYFLYYFSGNVLYIMAYGFLLFEICKSISWFHLFKNYKIHIIVLAALDIYIIYVLQAIINPVAVYDDRYFLELIYNAVLLLLLSSSLLNYFYRDNKKSLFLFIGSLCIVFSEVINVAYLYIVETSLLIFMSSCLALSAFYFYYQQSNLENEKPTGLVTQ
ncbi:hypothetical protein APS56_16345 [Pseudalgibacter alginicilyticus]|uniref:YhhN-like protein n=1 Tax=Pseudalgibacter alginicilyticus TaxID=1736674 RepID=A0A0P0D8Z3_9FLAO|nr:hypothetical protein [Pseudalgibacter alginicilyticus]ALJ06608.1 hypothetical protein APS56_16345 [Pseudalgibacter alginicilyticus]